MTNDVSGHEFERERRRLIGLAYRMLGSVAEAEDVVQDAFLRVRSAETSEIRDLGGILHTTVARLCLDRMKSAQARREKYVGTWLPEPVVSMAAQVETPPTESSAADVQLERLDDLSFALMMTLQRLNPQERTAFLLHDVFGQDYGAIAAVLDSSESTCRKLAERARHQVQAGRPRFQVKPEDGSRLLEVFLLATRDGDADALVKVLADDATLYTDGGGKRQAALNPIHGADNVARFFKGISKKSTFEMPVGLELVPVNGLPGFVLTYATGDIAVGAIAIEQGRIQEVYIVRNPDKLQHLAKPAFGIGVP